MTYYICYCKRHQRVMVYLFMAIITNMGILSCDDGTEDPGSTPTPPSLLNWTIQPTGLFANLSDIHFNNSSFGWAVGKQVVLATATGGSTWPVAPLDSTQLPRVITSVCFISEQQGWLAAGTEDDEGGAIYISEQGGAYPVLQASYDHSINSVFFIDRSMGWGAGTKGKLVSTINGGMEWALLAELNSAVFDIHFTTNAKGWIVGENGSIYHTNDGKNFQQQDIGTDKRLNAVHFTDTLNGWVCGDRNTIYRRHMGENNEITWTEARVQELGSGVDWNDIYFIDRFQGWVVGTEGRIYTTIDGGISWTRQIAGTFEILNAIHMVSSTKGWIAGDNGLILTYAP